MKGEQTLAKLQQSSSRGFGSRQTRSHSAPAWTETDLLILVNEVTAVEADCRKEFSSFQKWKIVSHNCGALSGGGGGGVTRTQDQHRCKWEALLHNYKVIHNWNLNEAIAYWDMGSDQRKRAGLPRSFDREVFKAIGGYEKLRQENQMDSEPEGETEVEADVADEDEVVVEPESKRRKRQSTQQKCKPIQNSPRRSVVKKPVQKTRQTHAAETPLKKVCPAQGEEMTAQNNRQMCVGEKTIVKTFQTHVAEKAGEKPCGTHVEEKAHQIDEEKEPVETAYQTHGEEMLVEKIHVQGEPLQNSPKTCAEENVVDKSCDTRMERKPVEESHQTYAEGKHGESCLEAVPMENLTEQKLHPTHEEENHVGSCLAATSTKKLAEEKKSLKRKKKTSEEQPGGSCSEELRKKSMASKKTPKSGKKRKQKNTQTEEKSADIKEQEQIMAMKLHWSAELIRNIVTENAESQAADEMSTKDLRADLVQRKGTRSSHAWQRLSRLLTRFIISFRNVNSTLYPF